MIDINIIRNNFLEIYNNLKKRNFYLDYSKFCFFDDNIKNLKKNLYNIQYKKNIFTILIKNFKFNFIKFNYLIDEILLLKRLIIEIEFELKNIENDLIQYMLLIPNIIHKSVPFGLNSNDNLELRTFINLNQRNFSFLNDLESNKNYIDFDLSSNLSGSGFVILKDELAELYRALGNYMIDLHVINHGYKEIFSPLLVNENTLRSTGHIPKFSNDLFKILDFDLWLIPTSEVILANLINKKNLLLSEIPLNFVSKTSCFRKEIGNYGYKVKGLIRQHQFDKVELVKIVHPKNSYSSLEELVYHAEKVLQNLSISYRVMSLCSYDIGFASSKTYDLEVWFPKRKMYIEVSSCSNTESFQSFRMKSRIKNISSNNLYPHVLNGSGLAIGRVFLALIENYSDNYGNLIIPDVLVRYMNGKNLIKFI